MGCVTGARNNDDQEALLDTLQSILKSDSPPKAKIFRMLKEFSATWTPASAQEILDRAKRPKP
jgi:hypothetical protein